MRGKDNDGSSNQRTIVVLGDPKAKALRPPPGDLRKGQFLRALGRLLSGGGWLFKDHVSLRVIPLREVDGRPVLRTQPDWRVAVSGPKQGVVQDCGQRGSSLVVGMDPDRLINVVIGCNACGAFNESLGEEPYPMD